MLALPPGRRGLPLLGETLALLRNPYEFLTLRRARHGAVFRSRILGRDVAFLHGPEGVAAFLDQAAGHDVLEPRSALGIACSCAGACS